MVTAECGIAIGPLLAGAGIAGLAIGFGAQSLVKDVISGFFIILENQIRVGDVVTIAGAGGIVEEISLRTIRLRDVEGRVHIVPNGLIEVATNFTHEWSRALVEIPVAYKEDVDRVIAVLQEVGEELRADPDFSDLILEPMTVQGLDSFGDSSVNIRIFFKTVPIRQWDVAREFRKRVKKTFDQQGISIPFPHRTVFIESGPAVAPPPPGRLPPESRGARLQVHGKKIRPALPTAAGSLTLQKNKLRPVSVVTPACKLWMPACAGMTRQKPKGEAQ